MLRTLAVSLGFLMFVPCVSLAVPTQVVHDDLANCDPLVVPPLVDELGLPPVFPDDELITSAFTFTLDSACPGSDNPDMPNVLVTMTNLSPTRWFDVWYVADPPVAGGAGTTISNFDGVVDGIGPVAAPGQAFKIDRVGVNRPLVLESFAADGIFAVGETWHFIIDDYFNTGGLAPSLFDSIGVAGLSLGGAPSSGSIIASPIPEPGTMVLLLVGAAMLSIRTRLARKLAGRLTSGVARWSLSKQAMVGCCAVVGLALALTRPAAAAPVNAVSPGSLTVSDVITFGSTGSGGAGTHVAGILDPAAEPGASFAERFAGQTQGTSGNFDTLSGGPSNPLTLVAGVANQNLSLLGAGDTELTGVSAAGGGHPDFDAIGEGAVSVLYDFDQFELAFDVEGTNSGSATVHFIRRDGSLIDSFTIGTLADISYAFRRDGNVADIAGISLVNTDPFGVAYDNFVMTAVPEPGTVVLFGLGTLGLAAYGRRRRRQPGVAGSKR